MLRDLLTTLRQTRDGGDATMSLVIRALSLLDEESAEVLAFVKGQRVGSVDEEWGDNGRSFWAHLYPVPGERSETEIMVTLQAEGAVSEYVGIFASRSAALAALSARGAYKEL